MSKKMPPGLQDHRTWKFISSVNLRVSVLQAKHMQKMFPEGQQVYKFYLLQPHKLNRWVSYFHKSSNIVKITETVFTNPFFYKIF